MSTERRVEAVVAIWGRDPCPPACLGERVRAACAAGLEIALLEVDDVPALAAAIGGRPAGPGGVLAVGVDGRTHRIGGDDPAAVQGLAPGGGDVRGWLRDVLWRRGIAPGQVLCLGDATAGVGERLCGVLADQIARRARGELPAIDAAPGWSLSVAGVDPLLERAHEALLTLADGRLGTRGSSLAGGEHDEPAVLMAGVYSGAGAATHLLAGPRWNALCTADLQVTSLRRTLELHTGTLREELLIGGAPASGLALSSLARPGVTLLCVRGQLTGAVSPGLAGPNDAGGVCLDAGGTSDGVRWLRATGVPGSIAAATGQRLQHIDGGADWRLDRITAYEGAMRGAASVARATRRVVAAVDAGVEASLCEHRRAWAQRWEDADVRIEGDAGLQRDVRFALFHLIGSVGDGGEAAVGARGLSGSAYRGHVFWDSDVYVLPFHAVTHPPSARAMLEYRVRRLGASLQAARALGGRGARFAWESATGGEDVTPTQAPGVGGEMAPVQTGRQEEHIVADVAWAAACYVDWTGDGLFAAGPGGELVVQSARWWAARIALDADGRGHIRRVMGPDEYHENVDDDVYTNVMARWNLRRAAALAGVEDAERRRWLSLADTLVDGYDASTGIHEQFAGFHALEPLLIADVAPGRPVAADLLLGRERTRGAQVVKQPDVLMAHYLVPEEMAPGSLAADLAFYEPRTAHGSSLSLGVHAALLARVGRPEAARDLLRLTTRIDLDDLSQTTAGGLHLAAMGSVWGALAFGFAGLRPAGDALAVDPMWPAGWADFELRVRFRGSRVRVCVRPDDLDVRADRPVLICWQGERVRVGPEGVRLARGEVVGA